MKKNSHKPLLIERFVINLLVSIDYNNEAVKEKETIQKNVYETVKKNSHEPFIIERSVIHL